MIILVINKNKALKKGSKISIKAEKPNIVLRTGETWEVIGFNYYLGEETYHFKRKTDDGMFQTTHCIVKDVDNAISTGFYEILKKK